MIHNTTNVSWSKYIREAIEEYDFSHVDKNLINMFPKNWLHPINTKFNCYRNNINGDVLL